MEQNHFHQGKLRSWLGCFHRILNNMSCQKIIPKIIAVR